MEVKFFDDKLEYFIVSLDKITIAKILRIIDLLEKFGFQLEMPHSKSIGQGMFELRIRGQREIRIIYTFKDNQVILLHGFIKKTQKLPIKELLMARKKLNSLDSI